MDITIHIKERKGKRGIMKKLVFVSTMASPHQIRFAPYLQKYFDVHFFFYEQPSATGKFAFWRIELGERCKILSCWFKWRGRYLTLSPIRHLCEVRPDILILGGFSVPANYLCYLWARWHGVKIVIQTERSRDRAGNLRGYGLVWRFIHFLYRKVDLVQCISRDTVPQFRDTFRFGDKAVFVPYPCDTDKYFEHPVRTKKDAYTLIYPNRMTDIYDPLLAIDIFADVLKRHPKTRLVMNAAGELRPQVESAIMRYGIGASVEFLDDLKHWDDLDAVYRRCDIMFLPAKYSNGNNTLSEAMCSGMAPVISDAILGGWPQMFVRTGGGFVCPHSRTAFVERICWIIEHPEVYAKITPINRENRRPWTMAEKAKIYRDVYGKLFVCQN